MKKASLTILASLIVLFVYSQQTKIQELSNAEQFSTQSGTLIEKQFIDIGNVKSIDVQVLKLIDLVSGKKMSALRLEYKYKGTYSSDTKVASLDTDELDGLIKSLNTIQTTIIPSTRETYTEVTFTSRTGFKAGAFYSVDSNKWRAFLQLEKYDSDSNVFISTEDLTALLVLIKQANSEM